VSLRTIRFLRRSLSVILGIGVPNQLIIGVTLGGDCVVIEPRATFSRPAIAISPPLEGDAEEECGVPRYPGNRHLVLHALGSRGVTGAWLTAG
jgi:hypothetical protein